jgi:hypothetical protein
VSTRIANALLQPATGRHVVASTAVIRAASTLRALVARDSAVLISPIALLQTVFPALAVLIGRSARLALTVKGTFV